MNRVLIIVDMQNDFIDGTLGTPEAVAIVPNVVRLINQRNAEDANIIYTRDTHFDDYEDSFEGQRLPVKHCIEDTEGWQIRPEVLINHNERVFIYNKYTFGTIDGWDYEYAAILEDADEIEVVGLCTDICVVSNALILRAKFPDKRIVVYENCTAGVTPETKEAALTTMKMCQIDVETF